MLLELFPMNIPSCIKWNLKEIEVDKFDYN